MQTHLAVAASPSLALHPPHLILRAKRSDPQIFPWLTLIACAKGRQDELQRAPRGQRGQLLSDQTAAAPAMVLQGASGERIWRAAGWSLRAVPRSSLYVLSAHNFTFTTSLPPRWTASQVCHFDGGQNHTKQRAKMVKKVARPMDD